MRLGAVEIGSIVRTRDTFLWIVGRLGQRPLVRRAEFVMLDGETPIWRTVGEPYVARSDIEVLEVVRDQTYHRIHGPPDGGESDPVRRK